MRITRSQLRRIIREQIEEEQEHSELDKILELFNNSSAHQAIELANMVGLGDTKEVKSMTAVHRLVKDWVELADKHIEGEQDAYELMENLKIIQKAAFGLQHSPEVKEVTVTPWLRGRKPGEGRSMPHGARPDWYHDIDLAETFYSQFQNNKYNHQEYGEKLREPEELEQYPNWLALKEWAGVP